MTISRFKYSFLSMIVKYRTCCSAMDPGEILKCDMTWLALKLGKYFYFPHLVYQTLSALRICHLPRQLSFCMENLKEFVIENTRGSHTCYCILPQIFTSLFCSSDPNKRHLDWGE